jgi:hypothetical protein
MTVDEQVEMNTAGVKALIRAEDTAGAVDAIIAAVLPFITEAIAEKIEDYCAHGHLVGDRHVCYRCSGAAFTAREWRP